MIGCGFVGSASEFALMQSGLFTEIVLIDADKNKAEGEAMDIQSLKYPKEGMADIFLVRYALKYCITCCPRYICSVQDKHRQSNPSWEAFYTHCQR